MPHHLVHLRLRLADGKSPDGIATKLKAGYVVYRGAPQVGEDAALHDAE